MAKSMEDRFLGMKTTADQLEKFRQVNLDHTGGEKGKIDHEEVKEAAVILFSLNKKEIADAIRMLAGN